MATVTAGERFTVIRAGIEYEFEPAEEGGYVVSVPLYPSCVSDGDSFEEALENIEDALQETLAAAKDLGLEIPEKLRLLVDN
jgi:predicted RNase H-like HicB family nuclease